MNTFILILTLITNLGGRAGAGGIATAEFDSLKGCETAGKQWTASRKRGTSWLCVKKF